MCTVMPRVHVAVTGIEKVLPTLEDLATAMRLLPRSATGQTTSNYCSLLTGPARGRAIRTGPSTCTSCSSTVAVQGLIGGEFQAMLRCIRCGACMNHCPVYQKVGGHTYGWVYPGPMGSVLTPSYVGLDKTLDLPQAATLCGECNSVCPVGIPLSDLLRKLREKQVARHLRPWGERVGLAVWGYLALRRAAYAIFTKLVVRILEKMGGEKHSIARLPLGGGWTNTREMPAPVGRTFRELYAAQRSHRG